MDMISLFIYLIFYLFISNWVQITIGIKTALAGKSSVSKIKDEKLTALIKKKTNLYIPSITIYETDKLFGLMAAIPLFPNMILSRGLYETFNKDELEWVVLHEAAHCIFWHVLKLGISMIVVGALGLFALMQIKAPESIFLAPIFSIISSLIFIRVAQHFEYEADYFSITHVENPRGVITAQGKFKNSNSFLFKNSIIRKYFHWNILPQKRIELAKAQINKI